MSTTSVISHAQSTIRHLYKTNPEQAFDRLCELVAELARDVQTLERKAKDLEAQLDAK